MWRGCRRDGHADRPPSPSAEPPLPGASESSAATRFERLGRPGHCAYGCCLSSASILRYARDSSNQQAPARSELVATFGKRVRQLRHTKEWSLRDLAGKVGVGFTYLSRVENERLNFGDYPSDALIHRLADALDADEGELLLLAKRVPEPVKKRVLQRPDAFLAFATCDDATLDKLMTEIGQKPSERKARTRKA